MIISHQHQFIFVRVPKTASTSVAIELSKMCGLEDVITPIFFKQDPEGEKAGFKGPQNHRRRLWQWQTDDWFRFLILHKNPKNFKHATAARIQKYIGKTIWDSYYKFCVVRNPFDRAISLYYWHLTKHANDRQDLNRFILGLSANKLCTWHRYTINNKIAMDMVCHYENLQIDLDAAAAKIGIPPLILSNAKGAFRKDRRPYSQLINPEAREHIEHQCSTEIEAFNYQWVSH